MTVATFYAASRWGSRYGVRDASHATRHKGLDIRASAHQAIPALRSGTIVVDLPSSSVGRYIVVRVGLIDYDTYCHVLTTGRKGAIKAGETIGRAAGYSDPHGTAWSGPHLHLCRSTTRSGWATWGPANRNPEPLVLSVLARLALPKPTPTPIHRKKDNVSYLIVNGSKSGTYRGDVVVADSERLTRKVGGYEREKAHCEVVAVEGDVEFLGAIASFSGGTKLQYDAARKLGNNGTVRLSTNTVYIAG